MKLTAQTLTTPMKAALEFYSKDRTHEAVAYPTTGTRVALIRRGLLTTAYHAWEHTLTADGESVFRTGLTIAEAFDVAVSVNTAFTIGADGGPANLDATEAAPTDAELAEKISRRVDYVNSAIEAVRADWSPEANSHALRMVEGHAWWLALYRAERDRRSREATVSAYVDGLVAGLKTAGRYEETPLVEIHQAAQDLLHGEALEQYRAERPAAYLEGVKSHYVAVRADHWRRRGYGESEALAFAKWDWLAAPQNPFAGVVSR